MRKRLFIFAAATCFALSAFATPAFAGEPNLTDGPTIGSEASVQSNGNSDGNSKEDAPPCGNEDGLPNEESYSGEGQTGSSVADPVVATIGGTKYTKLQDAITAACSDTASSAATITLQSDLELTEGLRFIGSGDNADQWKNITIDAANKYKLTLNNKGIYATRCKVTIQNCRELTVNAGTNPGNTDSETSNISAVLFCPGTLVLDECKTVNITNPEPTTGGSGLCIYNGGDLYIQNETHFTVSGFMNGTPVKPGEQGKGGCSGIYIDSDEDVNHDYTTITGQIVVSNNSTLTATECYHNGITANPVNITVKGSSTIKTCDNNTDESDGKGGLCCYFGKLTVAGGSSVVSTGNTGWGFGIFVRDLDVDGNSKIVASNNGSFYHYGEPWNFDNWDGTGLAIAGTAVLHSGAEVTTNDNWGIGVWVYRDADNADSYPGGTLTVESGATLSSIHNANYGLANAYNLNIRSGAHVYLRENYDGGLDNYPLATTTVDTGADFVVSNNCGRGIKNGNSGNNHIGEPATLILNSGVIKENYNTKQMPSFPFLDAKGYGHNVDNGGGIYNEYGSVTLSSVAKVYNNHAENSGDDLYNSDVEGNSFNIVKLEPGAKWSVLDDDGCIIDDWYHDYAGEENRWKPATAKNNTVTILPLGAALKAAHGINAPTPSPKPAEPTAAPTEAPTPTAAPTTIPTVAPTAAPTTAPTAAPADNTATAAPATPAPTAQPTVTATPAPTAQASGVIPQTGDSSSPALFSILTLGSITALCVLQKRRKSK